VILVQHSRRCAGVFAAVCLAVAVTGCGGPYDAAVSGNVTLDGTSLPRGTVKFVPEQPAPTGYGLIGSDGSYEIMTGRERGLKSGSYVVTVVANEESTPNQNPSLPPIPGKPISPPWYRSDQTSTLRFTVEPGDNDVNLELTSQPPPGWTPGRRP
jgi:hypothetical protein